jgi:hypothetical protein
MYEKATDQSPFSPPPPPTTGNTIPSNFFMTSETCKRCHADIYEQWNSSMHHFSSFNNQWYRKSIEYMQDVAGVQPSKWCAGCHDHAVFFNGKFDKPIKEQIQTPEAQAGLACTSCHSIVRVKDSMGNGGFVIYPPLHDLATSDNRAPMDTISDQIDPEPRRKVFMKPVHHQDTAEMCSACHKVHRTCRSAVPLAAGFNDYDNWQASGVSGQGRAPLSSEPKKCFLYMPLVDSKTLETSMARCIPIGSRPPTRPSQQ